MERRNGSSRTHLQGRRFGQIEHQILLIPEAPLLLGLLLIGLAYDFPPVVGVLAVLVVAVFLLRVCLIASTARQLERAHYRSADRLARIALGIYPWSADALALRAQGFLLRGDDDAAEPLLRRAARLAPDSDLIHSALAGTLLARGKFAAGREHAVYADHLTDGSPYAAQHLAWLALHVDADPVTAQRIVSEVDLDRLPVALSTPMLVMQAEVQIARGSFRAAHATLQIVEGAVERCPIPQHAEFLYHLGRLHELLGEDGSSYYRRSVEVDPRGRYARTSWRASLAKGEGTRPLAAS